MSGKNSAKVISEASPHTVKKFELISGYVEAWKEKLLNIPACKNLVFIDCMSGSGEYTYDKKVKVYGTPVRVAQLLRRASLKYSDKNVHAIFNDIRTDKIEHLKTLVEGSTINYHIKFYNEDCNQLLLRLWERIFELDGAHCLLVYDPYDASIDWNAIMPFLNNWGEVIINHMVSDPIRAMSSAIKPKAVHKYETFYQKVIEELLQWGSDRNKYEDCIEKIIHSLRGSNSKSYFIASFPFFNRKNVFLYDLIHCTGNIEGLKLYKKIAWQVFGGNSSNKDTHGEERQGVLEFLGNEVPTDDDCYHIDDIVRYIIEYRGINNIPSNDEIHDILDRHPIFPSDGFMEAIKKGLKHRYSTEEPQIKINF